MLQVGTDHFRKIGMHIQCFCKNEFKLSMLLLKVILIHNMKYPSLTHFPSPIRIDFRKQWHYNIVELSSNLIHIHHYMWPTRFLLYSRAIPTFPFSIYVAIAVRRLWIHVLLLLVYYSWFLKKKLITIRATGRATSR